MQQPTSEQMLAAENDTRTPGVSDRDQRPRRPSKAARA